MGQTIFSIYSVCSLSFLRALKKESALDGGGENGARLRGLTDLTQWKNEWEKGKFWQNCDKRALVFPKCRFLTVSNQG